MSRLYIIRDIYGTNTEEIREEYGTKGKLMVEGWPLTEGKARSKYGFDTGVPREWYQ
jgi:hypothetical protein